MFVRTSIFCATILITGLVQAAVVELMPGDLRPPAATTTAVSLQYGHTDYSGIYANGHSNDSVDTRSRQTLLTALHFREIKEVPVLFAAAVSHERGGITQSKPFFQEQNVEGHGDTRLGIGFWPLADRENQRYLALGAVVTLPTGEYENHRFVNPGENRVRTSLMAGYSTALTGTLRWDSFALYNLFGDNDEYLNLGTFSKDDSSSLTSYLVHKVGAYAEAYIGLEYIHGSDTYLNGIKLADGQRDVRGYLGFSTPLSRNDKLSIRLGTTVHARTGYHQDRQILVNLTHRF